MTTALQQLLHAFDSLPERDRHRAALEILRRVGTPAHGDLPDEGLVEIADELFRALDAEETGPAPR